MVELSYCVVNTEQRQLLGYCLDAIGRERATVDFETETLVLDNASRDGSAEAARDHPATTDVIALAQRRAAGDQDGQLLRRARGRFCLLLEEDSELEPGATVALHRALAQDAGAGAAGATLVRPDGTEHPSAWRFPSLWTRLVPSQLRRRLLVQSHGHRVRRVDWVPASARLVRREAAEAAGRLGGDEIEFCRRLRSAGWHVLYVPEARAVHYPRASAR